MLDFINYVIKGLLHYLTLIFGMLDFKELGFMWLIIGILSFCIIANKEVRKSIINLIKSFLGVMKTIPGFIFLILLISYYCYVAIFFEEKITIIVVVLSIYLFLQTFIMVNLSLLAESENSVWETIKSFSFPVILLYIQQITIMAEIDDFTNLNMVLYSLLIIPTFSLLFFVFKHYCIYIDFYRKHKKYIKISNFDFFKVFNESLIICKSYKKNNILLSEFIKNNSKLNDKEMKRKINEIFPKVIFYTIQEEKQQKKLNSIKVHPTKLFIFFNYIWLFNILVVVTYIFMKRFSGINFGFLYYLSYIVLIIYFLYDLLRIKKIENQYDFIIYLFIYIVAIVILLFYYFGLNEVRLTELGFMIPIFIYIRYKSYYKPKINFLNLPIISKNNFFGLDPHKIKTTIKK